MRPTKYCCWFYICLLTGLVLWPGVTHAKATTHKLKFGLVLSGGGARGLAHIGVLKYLEQNGLRPDYIVGTSMGAVIGSLYATGYSAAQLETMVLEQDWTALLQDVIDRDALSLDDKQDQGKYLASFIIRKGQLLLPIGLGSGQNITTLLSRMLFPARGIHSFRDLPIPFECVAMELATGQPRTLTQGYLPEAVRASMSIPSVFAPVEYEDRLLADGGVVRDLPVSNLLDLGLDMIVAVDVNSQLLPSEKLESLTRILDQVLLIYSLENNKRQAEKCQVVVLPKLVDYGLMSFESAREIIDLGEAEARAHEKEFQDLARKLGRPQNPLNVPLLPDPMELTVQIVGIELEGLHEVSKQFIFRRIGFTAPATVTCREIEQAMNRIYSSQYFQRVTYAFKQSAVGEILVVKVIENINDVLRLGLHYDTELNAMLMLNSTLRNTLGWGSELRLDAYLSKYVLLESAYFYQTGWQPGLGIGADLSFQNGGMAIYNVDRIRAFVDQTYWQGEVRIQGLLNSVAIGLGIEKEVGISDSTQTLEGEQAGYVESLNYLVSLKVDSLDRGFYPHHGWKIDLLGKYMTDDLSLHTQAEYSPFYRVRLNAVHVVPLHPVLSWATTVQGGFTLGDVVNPAQWFYIGGQTGFERNKIPFLGMRFIEEVGPNVLIAHMGLQFEPWDSRYIIVRANVGHTSVGFHELFLREGILFGYGLTLGILTRIGPIEATVMANGQGGGVAGFMNMGYPF